MSAHWTKRYAAKSLMILSAKNRPRLSQALVRMPVLVAAGEETRGPVLAPGLVQSLSVAQKKEERRDRSSPGWGDGDGAKKGRWRGREETEHVPNRCAPAREWKANLPAAPLPGVW